MVLCISFAFRFEDNNSISKIILEKMKDELIDVLFEIARDDENSNCRNYATTALTLLIFDIKAIDYLFELFKTHEDEWKRIRISWKHNLNGMSKSKNRKYFLNKIEELINGENETISNRAFELHAELSREHNDWFQD